MAIKTQYDKIEDVPDGLKEHAVEVDGKQVIEITDIETHYKVNALRKAYKGEQEKRKEQGQSIADYRAKIDAIPEDFNGDRWTQLKLMENNAVNPEEQKAKIIKELENNRVSVKADIEKKHEIEINTHIEKYEKMKKSLEKTYGEDRLRKGLINAGVAPELLDGAMAINIGCISVEKEGDSYIDIVKTDMGNLTAEEYALQWVQKDEGKHYVKSASGPDLKPKAGVFGVGGDNPWTPGSENLTQQTILMGTEEGRKKAARLKAAAGIK